jgi:FkbM family methyltransferase
MINKVIRQIKKFLPVKFKTYIKKLKKFNGDGLDIQMLDYINYKNGFYIECGANDGVNQSTTWYFERTLQWKGLLIEPIKLVYAELKKNRNKINFFSNTALRSFKYKKKYLDLYFYKSDTLLSRSTLDDKKRLKVRVKCTNLNSILEKIKAPNIIDFFSLDVEGDEFHVLNGINFKKYKFKFLLIESSNFLKLDKILTKHKYVFVKKLFVGTIYSDYLFKYEK